MHLVARYIHSIHIIIDTCMQAFAKQCMQVDKALVSEF